MIATPYDILFDHLSPSLKSLYVHKLLNEMPDEPIKGAILFLICARLRKITYITKSYKQTHAY